MRECLEVIMKGKMKWRALWGMAFLLLAAVSPAWPAVLYVPGQYASIQSAINAARSGDTVEVAAGVYNENITLKNGVTVQGSGADVCTIQGNGTTTTVFANQITQPAAISGFTITGGVGYVVSWSENRIMGGGLFADSSVLTISGNNIVSNTAQIGGGIALLNCHVNLTGNTISANNATTANAKSINMGGGIYLYDTQGDIANNAVLQNTVSSGAYDPTLVDPNGHMAPGGGICLVFSKNVGAITFSGNTISNNTATGSQFYGGGIYLYQASSGLTNSIAITGNTISQNQGLDGGGIVVLQCSPVISGNTITANSGHWGGGLYGYSGGGTISNNTFSGNSAVAIRVGVNTGGGGILCDEGFSPAISGNTFSSNTAAHYGGGLEVYSGASPTVRENRFISNTAPFGGGIVVQAASPTIERNYLYDNQATTQSGGGIFVENTGRFQVRNNLIVKNQAAGYGGGISVVNGGTPDFVNNTVVSNTAGIFGGGIHVLASSFIVMNNIVADNTKFGIFCDGSTSINSYNDVYGNTQGNYYGTTAGTGSISSSPLFSSTVTYELMSGSPCENAGNPDPSYNNIDGTRNTMGAYGGPGAGYIPVSTDPPAAPTLSATVVGTTVTISWNLVPNATGYRLYYAPYPYTGPSSIGSIDMGSKTSITVGLWEGAAFFIAVQAYNNYGSSNYSNIVLLII